VAAKVAETVTTAGTKRGELLGADSASPRFDDPLSPWANGPE